MVKNSGERQLFDPRKIVTGLVAASKGRPLTEVDFEGLAARVEERLRHEGTEITSEAIGLAVLDELGRLDQVAYLRFASVYKDFENIDDFEREARLIKVEPR